MGTRSAGGCLPGHCPQWNKESCPVCLFAIPAMSIARRRHALSVLFLWHSVSSPNTRADARQSSSSFREQLPSTPSAPVHPPRARSSARPKSRGVSAAT